MSFAQELVTVAMGLNSLVGNDAPCAQLYQLTGLFKAQVIY